LDLASLISSKAAALIMGLSMAFPIGALVVRECHTLAFDRHRAYKTLKCAIAVRMRHGLISRHLGLFGDV
jgi:hypothetical protein